MAIVNIGQMRHRLQLKLYSTLALVGLAVAGYGLFGLIPVAWIVLVAGASDVGSLAATGRGVTGFDWPFVIAVLFRAVMITLTGALLAWLAFRTWRIRRRIGPPPDSNGIEKSLRGRIIAVLIYGAAASVTGANMLYSIDPTVRDVSLATWGKTATGRIFAVESGPLPDSQFIVEHLRYQFRTDDGRIVEGHKNQLPETQGRTLKLNDTVEVTYLPSSPATNRADFSFSLSGVLEFFGLQFTVFAVGAWGFAVNSGLLRRHDEPGVPEPPDERVQQMLRTPTGMPRVPFGHRDGF